MTLTTKTSNNGATGLCLYIDSRNWYSVEWNGDKVWLYKTVNGTLSYADKTSHLSLSGTTMYNEYVYDATNHKLIISVYDSNKTLIESYDYAVASSLSSGVQWGIPTDWSSNASVEISEVKVESL